MSTGVSENHVQTSFSFLCKLKGFVAEVMLAHNGRRKEITDSLGDSNGGEICLQLSYFMSRIKGSAHKHCYGNTV